MKCALLTNVDVHFFRGDPTKGHDTWMYSITDESGYRVGKTGSRMLVIAALKAACDIEGSNAFFFEILEAALARSQQRSA